MPTLTDYPEKSLGLVCAAGVREMLSDDWTKPLVKVYFRGQIGNRNTHNYWWASRLASRGHDPAHRIRDNIIEAYSTF